MLFSSGWYMFLLDRWPHGLDDSFPKAVQSCNYLKASKRIQLHNLRLLRTETPESVMYVITIMCWQVFSTPTTNKTSGSQRLRFNSATLKISHKCKEYRDLQILWFPSSAIVLIRNYHDRFLDLRRCKDFKTEVEHAVQSQKDPVCVDSGNINIWHPLRKRHKYSWEQRISLMMLIYTILERLRIIGAHKGVFQVSAFNITGRFLYLSQVARITFFFI